MSMSMDIGAHRALIADELVRAFDERRLTLVYQPIIRLRDSEIVASEVLLRWECPGLGQVSPAVSIALAQERGLLVKLGEWIMRDACAQFRLWQKKSVNRLRLHLNISHYELGDPGFVSLLASVCVSSGLSPADIALEIARMPTVLGDAHLLGAARAVREFGAMLIADDVCSELSDPTWAASVPVDAIKLNRAFVSAMTPDRDEESFSRAQCWVASMREEGVRVLALGVETPTELRKIVSLGCDETQGYYFGGPMDANRFTSQLFQSGCMLPPIAPVGI